MFLTYQLFALFFVCLFVFSLFLNLYFFKYFFMFCRVFYQLMFLCSVQSPVSYLSSVQGSTTIGLPQCNPFLAGIKSFQFNSIQFKIVSSGHPRYVHPFNSPRSAPAGRDVCTWQHSHVASQAHIAVELDRVVDCCSHLIHPDLIQNRFFASCHPDLIQNRFFAEVSN